MAHEHLTGMAIKRLNTCISGDRKQSGRPVASRLWMRLPSDLQSALRVAKDEDTYNQVFERIREWFAHHPHPKPATSVPLQKRIHDARAQLGALRICADEVEFLWSNCTLEQKMVGAQAILDADAAQLAAQ